MAKECREGPYRYDGPLRTYGFTSDFRVSEKAAVAYRAREGVPTEAMILFSYRSIYLGETFCSYISVGNGTNHDVRDVGLKVEV